MCNRRLGGEFAGKMDSRQRPYICFKKFRLPTATGNTSSCISPDCRELPYLVVPLPFLIIGDVTTKESFATSTTYTTVLTLACKAQNHLSRRISITVFSGIITRLIEFYKEGLPKTVTEARCFDHHSENPSYSTSSACREKERLSTRDVTAKGEGDKDTMRFIE